jgi:hypothetical protein
MVPIAPLPDVRGLMSEHIAALAASAQHAPLAQLVASIDAIRATARAEGLGDVAMLASRLESAIAERGRSAVILSYLDAMAAAVGSADGRSCDADASASHADAWLASVAVRFAN